MIVNIARGAENDIADGYWFYEGQNPGLGEYFRSNIIADIESLAFYGGIHESQYGFHRSLSKRFPFGIYYTHSENSVTVVAVLDLRREPLWVRSELQERR